MSYPSYVSFESFVCYFTGKQTGGNKKPPGSPEAGSKHIRLSYEFRSAFFTHCLDTDVLLGEGEMVRPIRVLVGGEMVPFFSFKFIFPFFC